jgi:hypothetical protein
MYGPLLKNYCFKKGCFHGLTEIFYLTIITKIWFDLAID